MAGSGIRGQFEEKFKALLRDIEEEGGKVICFIDEVREYLFLSFVVSGIFCESFYATGANVDICADTLFNLGKAEGSIDAGQMIKPALARGLQLVGATTRMFIIQTTILLKAFY